MSKPRPGGRSTSLGLLTLFLVAGGGILLAGSGLGVAAGAAAGILVVGGVVLLGTSADRLMYVTVSILVLTITWNGIRVGGGAFGDVFMVMAFAAVVAYLVLERRSPRIPPWLMLAAIGFALAGLLSAIFPQNHALANRSLVQQEAVVLVPGYLPPRSDIAFLIKFELSAVLVPLLIATAATSRERCVRLLDLWTIGAVINAAVGVLDYAGIHVAPYAIAASRTSGLTIHPNYLALTAVMGTPTAMLWLGRSRRWTAAGIVAVLTLVGAVYASGSRDGIIAVIGVIAITGFAVPRFRRRVLPMLPILAATIALAVTLVLMFTKAGSHILHQVRLGGNDPSAAGSDIQRAADAHVAWLQIRTRPIEGVGFSVIEDAHDIYLQLLAAGGVIAMAAFIAYVGGLIASTRQALRPGPFDEVIAAMTGVVGWLANGIFDAQLGDKYLYVLPGLIMAMAWVATAEARSRSSDAVFKRPAPASRTRPVAVPQRGVPAL